jgi:uncharacterized OsmC-like protein
MEQGFSVELRLQENYRFVVDFEEEGMAELVVDEGPPLGEGLGPNPTRLLAAAVGNCMSASLLFCMRRARVEVTDLRTRVEGSVERNENGRLRVKELRVKLEPEFAPGESERGLRCLDLFQDFCTVGESVRSGIDVAVEVTPVPEVSAA